MISYEPRGLNTCMINQLFVRVAGFLFAAAEPLPAEKRVAVIQPCKGRRATPEARPTEKEKET